MIEIKNLRKTYSIGKEHIDAIQDINIKINDGDIFGIIGLSGAGKSTLVRCMNLLETPSEGEILYDGVDICKMPRRELLRERREIGMIFQNFNLLEQRNAMANICYPLEISGVPSRAAKERAKELLELVGLSDRANSFPSQLSGGQKQRVAIARALATDPKVLLCDEATSALDPTTTNQILDLLAAINKKLGVTIVVITHEMRVIEKICNRVAVIDNSRIAEMGSVAEVFMHPKSDIAKRLVIPGSEVINRAIGERCIRIVFDGQSSFEPVISNLSLECRAAVNILGADTKNIGGLAYGQMILQLPDDKDAEAKIFSYLSGHKIKYEEVGRGD